MPSGRGLGRGLGCRREDLRVPLAVDEFPEVINLMSIDLFTKVEEIDDIKVVGI
jgi:hypothetical protein